MLKQWKHIPPPMQCDEVRYYYDILSHKKSQLVLKRIFDIVLSMVLILVLALPMLVIAIAIVLDSPGGALYRQVRVTKHNKQFQMMKFRTMVAHADQIGSLVTVEGDMRVTPIGSFLRRYRLDELPQLIHILRGEMTFVGTRPEVVQYVNQYTPQMKATLLLPAGVTSEASIYFKDEQTMLLRAEDIDRIYLEQILPLKMKYNLRAMERFSVFSEIKLICQTVCSVFGQKMVPLRKPEQEQKISTINK